MRRPACRIWLWPILIPSVARASTISIPTSVLVHGIDAVNVILSGSRDAADVVAVVVIVDHDDTPADVLESRHVAEFMGCDALAFSAAVAVDVVVVQRKLCAGVMT